MVDEGPEQAKSAKNKRIRETIVGDPEFRQYMDAKWGVNLLSWKTSQRAKDAGLDPYYFWDPANPPK